jgi:hypothetical protein
LTTSIDDGGNAERSFSFTLGDIDSTDRVDMMKIELAELIAEPTSFFRGEDQHLIHTRGVLSRIDLGDPAHAFEHVCSTPQHQSLQRPHSFEIPFS